MSNLIDKAENDPFAQFLAQAEESPNYWAELARLEFTEKVIERMNDLRLTRSALARRLDAKPSFVTRLLSGQNNFELATMTRIARALESDFRCHLQPKGVETMWINVLLDEPVRVACPAKWKNENYRPIASETARPAQNYETVATAA